MSSFDPGRGDFTFYRNGPSVLAFRLIDVLTRMPIPLTGQRLWMQWRDYPGAAAERLDISTDDLVGDRIRVVNAANGEGEIILTEATKTALPWPLIGRDNRPTVLSHDLRLGPAGSEEVMFAGRVHLMTGTTR